MNMVVDAVDVAQARRDAHVVCHCRVNQAQLAVMSAIHRTISSEAALRVCELLNVLIAADELYCRAMALTLRLVEARRRGNMVDFWRAVGEIERFATERGT